MKTAIYTILVLAVGLAAGSGVRQYLEPPREERMAAFLESVCEPYVLGNEVDTKDLSPLQNIETAFGDPASAALITLQKNGHRTCSVSDRLSALSAEASLVFLELVDAWAERQFPRLQREDLTLDTSWDVFLRYSQAGPPRHGEHYILVLDAEGVVTVTLGRLTSETGA